MARKYLAGAAVVAATALLLTACSGGTEPAATDSGKPEFKRLVHAIGSDPESLNPALAPTPQSRMVSCLIYQGLIRVDGNYEVQPQLAKSWDISEDGLTYTFELQDAKFTDGEPLTAHDVVFSLTEVATLSSGFVESAKRVASVEEVDEKTVRVQLTEPFAPFLQSLNCDNGGASILPAHLFEGTDLATNPASTEAPVGTGPFMLDRWDRGTQVKLVRNPDYFKEGQPLLDEVVAKILPSASGRMLALMSGDVDWIYHYFVDRNSLGPIEKDKKFEVVDYGPPGDFVMVTNVRNAPFDNVKVRQALFTAIDRDFLLAGPMKGYGEVGTSAINTGFEWAYNPKVDLNKKYAYDPEAARKLLADAGYANGMTVRLAFDAASPVLKPMADAIAEYWSAIGVEVVLDGGEVATIRDKVFKEWDFDVSLWGFVYGGDPATGIARLYVSSSIGKAVYNNASGYSNPEVDALWAEGAQQTKREDRQAPYFKVQEILARDIPSVPLLQGPNVHAGLASITGMYDGLTQYGDWWDGVDIKR